MMLRRGTFKMMPRRGTKTDCDCAAAVSICAYVLRTSAHNKEKMKKNKWKNKHIQNKANFPWT